MLLDSILYNGGLFERPYKKPSIRNLLSHNFKHDYILLSIVEYDGFQLHSYQFGRKCFANLQVSCNEGVELLIFLLKWTRKWTLINKAHDWAHEKAT
jgi:hypothetical protein